MTNVEMVKTVLKSVAGNQFIDWGWLTSKVNQEYGVELTVAQVRRAANSYTPLVKVKDGFMLKGRAV